MKIKSDSKISYKEAKHAFVGLFFMICPSALYSDEFCLEKFGRGFENSKIKVRVSEVYPGQTAGDLKLDLKVLAVNNTIKMADIPSVLRYLGSKTPTNCKELYKQLVGPFPDAVNPPQSARTEVAT